MLYVKKRPASTVHTFFLQVQPDAALRIYHISHGIAHPGYETPVLIRKNYVVHLIISGQALHNQQIVQAGDMFLSRPVSTHKLTVLPGEPLDHYWLEFCGTEAEHLIARSPFTHNTLYHGLDFSSVQPLLHDAVYSEQSDFSAAMKQTGLLYLLFALLPSSAKTGSASKNRVYQAMDFLRLNLHQGAAIRDAACSVGLSERYLYRLFLKETGFTPCTT